MSAQSVGRGYRFDWSLLPLSAAVLLVCFLYTFAYVFVHPYPGLALSSDWVVQQVDPCILYPGWCEEGAQGIQVGDQLTAIGDLTHEDYLKDRRRVAFAGYGPGDRVSITLLRGGVQQVVTWPIPVVTGQAQVVGLSGLLVYVPFWLAGTVVLLFLRPRDQRWWVLISFHYGTALWLAVGMVSKSQVAASSLVTHALTWLLVPVYLHLHLLVPVPLFERHLARILAPLYVIGTLLAILELFQLLPASAYSLGLILIVLGSLGLLISRLADRTSPAARPVARLMLAGIGMALVPGLIVGVIPSLIDPAALQLSSIVVSLLVVPILPLSYTYAIYKRRMGTLEFRANRLLSMYGFVLLYGAAFVLIFLLGNWWLGLSGWKADHLASPDSRSVAFNLVVSIAFVLAAPSLRGRFQKLVDRFAYGTEHNPDDIVFHFTSRIAAVLDSEALFRLLAYQLISSLLIRQWALYVLSDKGGERLYAHGVASKDVPDRLPDVGDLLGRTNQYWLPATEPPGTMDWVLLVIPLTIRGNTVGLWLFGRRDPDDYYPQHDISLLNTLGSQVAVAIENTRLYEQAQQEIAERLRIEKSLRRERDISQQYLDVAGVMLVALNLDGEITLMNRRGYEILGYARGELEGRNWFDVCLPQRVRPEMERILQQLVAGEAAPEEAYEKPVLTRSGQERIISWHNTTLMDETGAIVGMLSSGEDVTDRVRAEEARMRLVAAIEQAGEAVIIVNDSGEAQYVNPSFERLTGYSEDEVLGHTPGILGGKTGKPTLNQQMWEGVRRGEPWSGHLQGEKKDGRSYEVEASVSPIEDPTRQTREYVVILRDVTQEVALEAQLRQAQKMEAVGRLAGGVAHDFNNLLTVIQGYTRLLDNSLSAAVTEKEPLRLGVQTDLREIERAAERAAELTRQLLAFSRKQMLQPKILNLNDVIRNVERMLGRLIGEDIDLVVRLDPALGTVKADPGQMEQVIMNLSINARDAMPNGGQLVLQTANFVLDAASARDHLDIEPGPYARLVVRDTGIGMDEETRSHLFEPFFTTKGLGKGTGLGLATVFGIVKQSDGDIQVSSRPGEGTSFEIYLPQVDEAAAVANIAPAHTTSVRGAETILLVEDEDTVRALAQRILRRYGYTVLQAADANEALAVIERYQDPIHLVVTDVIMPGGMGGGELVSRLSSVRPGMKVLFMSGYTDEVIGTRGVVDPGLQFLQKPFTPDALARKVRGVLDGS